MNNNGTSRTLFMVELALMVAVIFVMAFTPLGYFQTGGLSITFLTVPVAVGAMMMGPGGGAVCGLAFGLTSFLQCFGMGAFGTMLFSINPVGTAFVCIVPRIAEGWLCGLIFQAARKKLGKTAYFLGSISCPVLNTLLFMTALVAVFFRTDYIQGYAQTLGVTNPFLFAVLFVGLQGLIEAAVCTGVAWAVSRALAAAFRRG
ncbi:MAG: ECF transporter S component [Eubacteriales bacterium]|nr:ECF transporter S component [Eubacteriales bacterium]